jgi:hypothetical protein
MEYLLSSGCAKQFRPSGRRLQAGFQCKKF